MKKTVYLGVHAMISGWLLGLVSAAELTTESSQEAIRSRTDGQLSICEMPYEAHGNLNPSSERYYEGDTVEIQCHSGYRVPYTKAHLFYLRCGPNGAWRNLIEQDTLIHCKPFHYCLAPDIPNSTVPNPPDGYNPGYTRRLTCTDGYKPRIGGELITCRPDGGWEVSRHPGQKPECIETSCPLPNGIMHGNYTLTLRKTLRSGSRPVPEGSLATYSCGLGYRISDHKLHQSNCTRGEWSSQAPKCVKASFKTCVAPKDIQHGSYIMEPMSVPFGQQIPEGYRITYICNDGYVIAGQERNYKQSLMCLNGEWEGNLSICTTPDSRQCSDPPNVTHGSFLTVDEMDLSSHKYTTGMKVYYYCDNGYRLTNKENASILTCLDKKWIGLRPFCEKRNHCDSPQDIENGNWVLERFSSHYGIGTRISYTCHNGFKAMGSTFIECLSSGYWSDYAPRCLADNTYCTEPGHIDNGVYMCQPSHCALFQVGTEVHYVCNKDYELDPPDMLMQTCLRGGIWSGDKPSCKKAKPVATDTYVSFNASTLTVVIATSCGVLGLLVVVMVVVALQRRKKPRLGRLCHPSTPPPPPYNPTPPTGLVDDPDRVALIAFADGVQVVLPSYEEAIRSRPGSRMSRYTSDRGSIRSSSSRDYRPLPSLRAGGPQIREVPPDHHRNSIITTASTATRDNLSLALGSIDTMNISDGTSTSVTVDTASSNPSIATSQRAAAGSIESSSTNGSLAVTEDAPLLDQNHYNTETIRSHHSNLSDTHPHGNNTRCQCNERIGGYDTLHSQGSRSQSESSPIVEVPEEQKEA